MRKDKQPEPDTELAAVLQMADKLTRNRKAPSKRTNAAAYLLFAVCLAQGVALAFTLPEYQRHQRVRDLQLASYTGKNDTVILSQAEPFDGMSETQIADAKRQLAR